MGQEVRAEEEEPLLPAVVYDGDSYYVIYPDDPEYWALLEDAIPRYGYYQVEKGRLDGVREWDPEAKYRVLRAKLEGIPKDVYVDLKDVRSSSLQSLAEKLAQVSYHLTFYIGWESEVESELYLRKKKLEQVLLSERRKRGGKVTAKELHNSLLEESQAVRRAQEKVWELEALLVLLKARREQLDVLWKTISRIITTKEREPLD